MTALEKLAIRRIQEIAAEIDPQIHGKPFKADGKLTLEDHEEGWRKVTTGSSEAFNKTSDIKREVIKWTEALLKEV